MSKQIIHIGANKTGSTTLQRYLFSQSKDLATIGEDCRDYSYGTSDEIRKLSDSIILDDDIYYQREEVERLFSTHIEQNKNKTIVYSDEDISMSRLHTICAQRIYSLMPDSHILLVIRDQVTALSSWYTNHGAYLRNVPYRYWRQPVELDEWMEHCFRFPRYSPLDGFKYFQLIELYENLFGKEKITILYYEDFLNTPDLFMKQLSNLLEIEEDECKRHLVGRWSRKTSRVIILSDHWTKLIQEFYKDENKKLADKYFNGINRYEGIQ